jgi:hypothetical protein
MGHLVADDLVLFGFAERRARASGSKQAESDWFTKSEHIPAAVLNKVDNRKSTTVDRNARTSR